MSTSRKVDRDTPISEVRLRLASSTYPVAKRKQLYAESIQQSLALEGYDISVIDICRVIRGIPEA